MSDPQEQPKASWMAHQSRIGSALGESFLLTRMDFRDGLLEYGFGVGHDTPSKMRLVALAFRCGQFSGARLVVSSVGSPQFTGEDTDLSVEDMVRYQLEVEPSKAGEFVELLREDLREADREATILNESVIERLVAYARGEVFWWLGQASFEFTIAIIVAVMGLYFSTVDRDSHLALFGTLPVFAIMTLRGTIATTKLVSALRKLRQ